MFRRLALFVCALCGLIALPGCPQTSDFALSIGSPYPSLEKSHAIHPTSDGGFVVMGSVSNSSTVNGQKRLFLSKRSADGAEEWSYDYSHPKLLLNTLGVVGNTIKETPSGDLVVGGVLMRLTPCVFGPTSNDVILEEHPWRGFLLCVDAAGQEKWRYLYQNIDTVTSWIDDLSPTPDGGFGLAYTESRTDGGSRSSILRTNSEGTPTWQVQAPANGRGRAIFALDDGACVLAGTLEDPEPLGTVFLIKADADGDTSWSHTYLSLQAKSYRPRMTLRQLEDGSLLLAGCGYTEGTFFLLKVNADGNETGRYVSTAPLPYRIHSIFGTGDGGCILGAEEDTAEGVTLFVVKINPLGQVQWTTPLDPSGTLLG